jgi:DNA-binding transcriptional LysR family regulator
MATCGNSQANQARLLNATISYNYCRMWINFEILDVRAFIAIADLRSFRGAAAALGLSQPALSRRIQGLERALGTQLLERSTRRVAPTAAGRQLVPVLRGLVEELETTVLSFSDLSSKNQMRIAIACIPSAAIYFLPQVIDGFNKEFPGIRFRILDVPSYEGLECVARGDVEFGINIVSTTHADLVATPLLQDPFMLVCRREDPLARRRRITWSDLKGHRLIGVSRDSGNRIVLDSALARSKAQLNWFYEVNHLSTALGMVVTGVGAAVLPRLAIPRAMSAVVATRPIVDPIINRTIGVLQRRSGRLSPPAQRFRDQLFANWSGRASAL